jgi:acetyl-CoA synthetase
MRRILRKTEGDYSNFGDISTLLNPEIVDEIKEGKFNFLVVVVKLLQ